jgi:GT2 family glycosyltransferase
MKLFFLCPDYNIPSAGVRTIYRHVDILNANGHEACVVHENRGFKCTWFDHDTNITYVYDAAVTPEDTVVIPEIYGEKIVTMWQREAPRKVVFVQNAHTAFSVLASARELPYRHSQVLAIISASDLVSPYLNYVCPNVPTFEMRYSIDPALFYCPPEPEKRNQVAYMGHKRQEDITQVLSLLRFRGDIAERWAFIPIFNKSEEETAHILRQSKLFMSFIHPEGFSLATAEAMACGCAVVGYFSPHFFGNPPTLFHIRLGNTLEFAKGTEHALRGLDEKHPDDTHQTAQRISAEVLRRYSPESEKKNLLRNWEEISRIPSHISPRKSTLKYSIITPVWNNVDLTTKYVTSIFKHSRDFELILIDNGSTDNTPNFLKGLAEARDDVHVITSEKNLGWAPAINRGVEVSSGDILVLCANDVTACPEWLEKMAAHLQYGVGAVGPLATNVAGRQNSEISGRSGPQEATRVLIGFCMMIPRVVFDEVGPWDIRFTEMVGSDDLDYSLRMMQAGYRLRIACDVELEHEGGASMKNLVGGKFGTGSYAEHMQRGNRLFKGKHGPAWFRWMTGLDLVSPAPLRFKI